MSNKQDNHSKNLGSIAKITESISELGNSAFGYYLGFGLFMGLAVAATRWDGHLFNQKGCIELQKIDEIIYKVNTCTGDITPISSGVKSLKKEKN